MIEKILFALITTYAIGLTIYYIVQELDFRFDIKILRKHRDRPTEQPLPKQFSDNDIMGESTWNIVLRNNITEHLTVKKQETKDNPQVNKSENEDEDVDLNEEDVALEETVDENHTELASGVTFDEIIKTKKIVNVTSAPLVDERVAGKVLYQIENSELYVALFNDNKNTERIAQLINLYMNKIPYTSIKNKEEYQDFNIDNFI